MKTILKQFISEPLFDACAAMLSYLHITFNEVTRTPIPFDSLYPGPLTKALQEIMMKVEHTYFIGTVDETSLSGHATQQDEGEVTQQAAEGKYVGMMIFAVNIISGQTLTRTEMATLTRGFNRIAAAQPVVLFIKEGDRMALATCERSEYTQQWRDGEKLGKVSMLRNINCQNTHRGHLDILESIGDKAYPTFEELYKHWMQVFSSELLTKKFYGELSDWYAWAVQVARFPNDLTTTADDEKFNHESCIRLITRLIFVWFLKQKHLIPNEFFDEQYIREHFIEEFNPHDRENLLYNPEKSRYYRLILQNLFFAMLNRPIVPEGKDTPNNRRFRVKGSYRGMNPDYAVNNLLRYEGEFKDGGAAEFLQMANSSVPFLNGGLFDCLDDKPKNLYYDGFSERKESLEQLYLPDWLFFGDEVGRSIDLSEWYGDAKKKKVSARGIIDILKRYNFTIEENTPLDQEVSLDPELLGKAFENLLASYNPETKTSARKQTGSFYTPREIVQYMVDESLVAHLKRICGDDLEPEYRALLSYATEETTLDAGQRKKLMQAIYNCRVLDPACGSGAFPMGVLQQMVHILRQLDPTNEMWRDFMIDHAIEQSRQAFSAEEEEERKARLADIEEAFDKSINDPDYARKLYLIEHCIFGVDIQPIAVQISKLRFFISLVVDQKPTNNAAHNFGIRPLPNLESKFVAANTLIPVDYDASLFESTDAIISKKEELRELNHQIFLAKRNIDKQRLKDKIKSTRKALAKAIEDTGFVKPGAAQQLADWDMFEQNTHAEFFDAEWMFGVKGGFDIVIGNPPYVNIANIRDDKIRKLYQCIYSTVKNKSDLYSIFTERAHGLLTINGLCTYIFSNSWLGTDSFSLFRKFLVNETKVIQLVDLPDKVFESATVKTCIILFSKEKVLNNDIMLLNYDGKSFSRMAHKLPYKNIKLHTNYPFAFEQNVDLKQVNVKLLGEIAEFSLGIKTSNDKKFISNNPFPEDNYRLIRGRNIQRYCNPISEEWIWYRPDLFMEKVGAGPRQLEYFIVPSKIIIKDVATEICATIDDNKYLCNDTLNLIYKINAAYHQKYILGLLNSKVVRFWHKKIFPEGLHIKIYQLKEIPVPVLSVLQQKPIIDLVDQILSAKKANPSADTSSLEQQIDLLVYHLYGLTYDEVLIVDPATPITREEYNKETIQE